MYASHRPNLSGAACSLAVASSVAFITAAVAADTPHDHAKDGYAIRSVAGGAWSDVNTWSPKRIPGEGDHVLIAPDTRVVYDADSTAAIRSIRIAGVLTFARDRDTSLTVGLIRVGPMKSAEAGTGVEDVDDHDHGDDAHGHGHGHAHAASHGGAALEVGTAAAPIPNGVAARIVLHYFKGDDADALPAIICRPGGRFDVHGAPIDRTWVELGQTAQEGDTTVALAEKVTGWRKGDEVLLTASVRRGAQQRGREYLPIMDTSETRRIVAIDGQTITLDKPLAFEHEGRGVRSAEIANLTRNIVITSSDDADDKQRGHTMHHRYSLGSISYARFHRLGKRAVLGRYPIHFHLVGDTMRGSSVVGAVITESGNRWVTVHGTQYMVVRDCIGYDSIGHGYFLEDGTEVYNVIDRNLGAKARRGERMRNQALPFDPNDGAAFWWANGRNTFTRNSASQNHEYGYRYDSQKRSNFDSDLPIRMPDGSEQIVDIRTLPIYRFQHNESHTEGLYSYVFAGTDGAGPDTKHPHMVKDIVSWNTHYALRSQIPTMWIENVTIDDAAYGVYRPWYENHVYRNLTIRDTAAEPFNRGQDDDSEQHGVITVDGLYFEGRRYGRGMPFIQISDNNLSGRAESHFRNVHAPDAGKEPSRNNVKPLVNRGGGRVVKPKTDTGVPIYIHDYFGPGRHAKVISTAAKDYKPSDSLKELPPLTGDEAVVEEVADVEFPKVLDPVDDHPPATIITYPARGVAAKIDNGTLTIRGTTTDNTAVKRVIVNGVEAKDVDYNFAQWEVTLKNVKPGELKLTAHAVDHAGNVEQTPHTMNIIVR